MKKNVLYRQLAGQCSKEQPFDKAFKQCSQLIAAKVKIAQDAVNSPSTHADGARALGEAIAIADTHGVPFTSSVIAIGNYLMASEMQYVPDSYFSLFKDLDPASVEKLTNVTAFALSKYVAPVGETDNDDYWDDYEDEPEDEPEQNLDYFRL